MRSFYPIVFQLLFIGLLGVGPLRARAQAVPPGEGLVADSTELRVLRQFYAATGGPQWTTRTNWLTGTTLAEAATWFGVRTAGGDVVSLSLGGNGLRGEVPSSLGQLRALDWLSFDSNALTGLPATVGRLARLRGLSLASNELTSLPDSLSRLAQLTYLNAGNNQLRGPLPVGLRALRHLYRLYLHNNALDGPLPAWVGRWTDLFALEISGNHFSGPLPDSLATLAGLSEIDLANNAFTGPLPAALGGLRALRVLAVSRNAFSGPLPAALSQCPGLTYLFVDRNQFSGRVPGAWGRLNSLRQLFISYNRLSGPLPDSLGLLRDLNYLDAEYNRFTGPLPAAFKGLRALTRLNLAYNQLSGVLPDSVRASFLNLDNNHFTGAVPATLHFYQITLNNNDLTQLPAYHSRLGYPYLEVHVTGNFLDFSSYEPNQWQPGVYQFWDYGQRTPGPADTLQVVAPAGAQLDGAIGGAHNMYQWQRQVGGQWVDLPGDTLRFRTWKAVGPADAGLYRTRVTNTWVPVITLYSRDHYLDIIPYPAPPRNRPDDINQGLALAAPLPAPDATGPRVRDINFVRTWSPRVALTDSLRVPRAGRDSVATSTTYLDGLGRPVQTVRHRASPQAWDLVQPVAYDALGRSPKQYLPYPADPADTARTPQGYHYRAVRDQQQFYYRTGPPGGDIGPLTQHDPILGVARTGRAFAETLFEASPLNRVVAQGAAGEAWQLTNGHAPERSERPNTAADSVLRFAPGYAPAVVDPGYQGFYAPGALWGVQTSDEHGTRTLAWTDQLGQLVLRQGEAAHTGTGASVARRWLRTAYAYDDFGRLRFVLQPEGSKRLLPLAAGAALPASAAPFLFHYRYDGRGRQVAKQVPGTDGETLVVFDQLDRPVLSQDAAQRARREWSWTKYDALGRVVLAGLVIRGDTAGQVSLQALAAADTTPETQYEQRTADDTRYPHFVTTDQSFPKLGQAGFGPGTVLSVTYYDDYNFDNDAAGVADASYNTSTDGQFPSGAAPVADALRTTGMSTRTKTRVLGVDPADPVQAAWLTTTTFYDERARPVQVQTTNARKGLDLLTTQLNFPGQVVQSVAVHEGPNHAPVTVAEFFTYDHTGRLLTTRQQLPGEARPVRIDSVAYNEIGQTTQKTMGTGRLAQAVKYAYNVRGWLTQLNDPYYPMAGDLFNLSLHYEQGFSQGYEQYNGNLTGQTWRSGRDGVQRAYGYVYDPLNRLLQGDFVARTASVPATPNALGLWKAEADNYRLSFVSYDDNGNIQTLRRRGLLANATHAAPKRFGPVDALTYAYAGNRLQAVDDQVSGNQLLRPRGYNGAPTSLAGDFQEGGTRLAQEYLYDANGNLTQDRNKGITGIQYNHLNLPRLIRFGMGADSIVFRYTAAGQKVAKLVYQTGKPMRRTDYLGPFQYEQDSLRFFPHAEGRVLRFANTTSGAVRYEREYTFKDHLGNLRLAYRLGQHRTYTATLEQDATTHGRESQQFDSLSVSPPVAQAVGPLARTGTYAARLNAGGPAPQPLGPLTQLAVQKGDTVTVTAPGYYPQPVSNSSFAFSLASFVAGLLQPPPGGLPADGRRGGLPLLSIGISAALPGLVPVGGGVPKGYVRLLVFDADSNLVGSQTQQLSQAARTGYEPLQVQVIAPQDGYVSAYVGNESNADVYFDDVTVEHRQGLQIQETQYDPTGLELAGLSRDTPGLKPLNQYKFNGKEFQSDLGLNWNHQDWRFFDTQLARWHVTDPEIENGQESWTPYSFGFDNAVRYADADGQVPGEGGGPPSGGTTVAGMIYNTARGIAVSAINTLEMAVAFSPIPSSAVTEKGVMRVSADDSGGISGGIRPFATTARGAAASAAADGLDLLNTAAAVLSSGSAGLASRSLPMGAGMLLAETGGANVATNAAVQQGKKVATAAYEVGSFNQLKNRSLPGDGLELHHAVQQQPAKSLISGYKGGEGPAIALPNAEHRRVPTLRGTTNAGNSRNQLAKDIRDLRNHTSAPNSSLQKLVELNKTTYPSSFAK